MSEAPLKPSPPPWPEPPPAQLKKAPLPEPLGAPAAENLKAEDNPFVAADWRMKYYAWAGFSLRFVLIFGAVFSVVQFLAAREEKRVERALELVELWERPEYHDAQRALKDRLAGLNARYASLLGDRPSAEELAVYYDRVGQEIMTAEGGAMPLPEFRAHFDRVVYFLNRLSFCVEGRLCSAAVTDAYFQDYALSFWQYFAGYVEAQRQGGQRNFAKPIETYVARALAETEEVAPPDGVAAGP